MLASTLAAAAEADDDNILCTILLFGAAVALIVGIAQVLGLFNFGPRTDGLGRFSALIVAIILIVAWAVFC